MWTPSQMANSSLSSSGNTRSRGPRGEGCVSNKTPHSVDLSSDFFAGFDEPFPGVRPTL
jgi:hypothetical protein